MRAERGLFKFILLVFLACAAAVAVSAQQRSHRQRGEDAEFGPNVRAYLGYLHDEQEVVDDRVSRREIKRSYYLHNSNRIYALRQMALQIARASDNDYLPELEAVSQGEFDQLFDGTPPKPADLQVGGVLEYKLRYLGSVLARGERFYLFARLDPYEQAELRKKGDGKSQTNAHAVTTQPAAATQPAPTGPSTRPRRINTP
jgi:hypothetical protein